MGEYAKRRSDGKQVKIGTCADMYYIRFEDRFKVSELPGHVNLASDADVSSLRFRLPFPDEDHLRPGDYRDYHRFEPLYGEYEIPADVESGTFQMRHESGLLLSFPCFHGVRLPDKPDGWYVDWNGKKASAVLSSVRAAFDEAGRLRLYPVVRCRWCDEQWRESWERIWPLLSKEFQRVCDQYLRKRHAMPHACEICQRAVELRTIGGIETCLLHVTEAQWEAARPRAASPTQPCRRCGEAIRPATGPELAERRRIDPDTSDWIHATGFWPCDDGAGCAQPERTHEIVARLSRRPVRNAMPVARVFADPSASFWLRDALRTALDRDLVDAAADARVLADILDERCTQALGRRSA